jgi:hypothetical protein
MVNSFVPHEVGEGAPATKERGRGIESPRDGHSPPVPERVVSYARERLPLPHSRARGGPFPLSQARGGQNCPRSPRAFFALPARPRACLPEGAHPPSAPAGSRSRLVACRAEGVAGPDTQSRTPLSPTQWGKGPPRRRSGVGGSKALGMATLHRFRNASSATRGKGCPYPTRKLVGDKTVPDPLEPPVTLKGSTLCRSHLCPPRSGGRVRRSKRTDACGVGGSKAREMTLSAPVPERVVSYARERLPLPHSQARGGQNCPRSPRAFFALPARPRACLPEGARTPSAPAGTRCRWSPGNGQIRHTFATLGPFPLDCEGSSS